MAIGSGRLPRWHRVSEYFGICQRYSDLHIENLPHLHKEADGQFRLQLHRHLSRRVANNSIFIVGFLLNV